MRQYLDLLRKIKDEGDYSMDRTGVGTYSIFGHQMRFNLSEGFPLLTTKKMATKAIISELLWFLEGSTDERRLAEIHYGKPAMELVGKNTIWTANADAQGIALGYYNDNFVKELGPVYGKQWRNWSSMYAGDIDQIKDVIENIKNNPGSRRHIVSAWNVGEIESMALPCCHVLFQLYVRNGELSCQMYQRSADVFLGTPFNIASYALLTMMIAQVCNLGLGDLIYTTGDTHIYANHLQQVEEQLTRDPMPLPLMQLDLSVRDIDDFKMDSFELVNYHSHDKIYAPMAV